MRINLLTSFAAGIFLSTSICGAVYFSGNNGNQKAAVKTNQVQGSITAQQAPTTAEMKKQLTSAGYIVQTKKEYNKNLKKAGASGNKNASNNQSQKVIYRTFVNVTQGMTSIDVGNILAQSKLIPDAFKFSQDIQSRGLENNLRPGTYQVDSSMSYDQIISTIFK